ncbi:shikimate kinase [Litchfieldia alkalitelluris]|uniref:shikimate kinase n=1 Tax=Litchfieldia alkalitelluris TaxID=304268 RepID=UPI0009986ADE|nr:shikimate kinase [Litchfieldia alkalitelluris]
MKAIYLTGFMGAGKTTIGQELANRLQLPVIDTDLYIVEQVGKTIPEIFAEDGEKVFRKYEREYIQKLPTEDVIITTGGGIVIQEENRNWMKEHGTVIYLHCEIEEVFNRVSTDGSRPLIEKNQKEKVIDLYHSRLSFYNEADVIVDTTQKNIDDVVKEIDDVLKNLKSGDTL